MPKSSLINKLSNIIAVILVAILLVGIGFYMGYKSKESSSINDKSSIALTKTENKSQETQSENNKVVAKDVDGVFWLKVNADRTCPDTHQIKGTFTPDNGNYYTKTNKNFERVKADICFASEEFARDKAGFIKKF